MKVRMIQSKFMIIITVQLPTWRGGGPQKNNNDNYKLIWVYFKKGRDPKKKEKEKNIK